MYFFFLTCKAVLSLIPHAPQCLIITTVFAVLDQDSVLIHKCEISFHFIDSREKR